MQSLFYLFPEAVGHLPEHLIEAMKRSPYDKCPVSSVPETAHKECDHQVAVLFGRSLSVAAERYVYVVHKPGRERDVPSSPVFLYALCQIWILEVVHKPKAKHPRASPRYIRIPAEIAVYLETEHHRGQYKIQPAVASSGIEHRVHSYGHPVGYDDLFEKSPEHYPYSADSTLKIKPMLLVKLGQKVFASLDGAGHKLWEKHYKEHEYAKMPLRLNVSPVNVNGIGCGLKCVE